MSANPSTPRSSSSKTHILLIHGAWHTPKHYDALTTALSNRGISTACPQLLTCSNIPDPSASFLTDVAFIRSHLEPLLAAEKHIILLCHSYGGAVGTQASYGLSLRERTAQGLPGGIVHIIYMCAFMLQAGESLASMSQPRPVPEPVVFEAETGTTFLCSPPRDLFYHDANEEVAREAEEMLVRQSAGAGLGEVTEEGWRDEGVGVCYWFMEEDKILFPWQQEKMIQGVRGTGKEVDVRRWKASHSPFLSRTEEMVEAVEMVVRDVEGR